MKSLGTLCLLSLAIAAAQAQTISRITVTPSPAFAVPNALPVQFHAVATYTSGATQDVTSMAVWTSDSVNVATVNAAGLATGLGGTSATITATLGPLSARALLNVESFSPGRPAAVATVRVGGSPVAVGVNPITSRVYVANGGTNDVTAIDGATYATTSIPAGAAPSGIAVNPGTNRIYVANSGSNNVTVIDGAANSAIATVNAGNGPQAIAVNAVTNKVYVANRDSVTVIDGQTNASMTISAANLLSIAVNPVTNRFYAGVLGNSVLVFDGSTNGLIATVAMPAGVLPFYLVANPVANQLYVGSPLNQTFTVVDGVTNAISQPPTVTSGAGGLAVNTATNKVVVAAAVASIFDPATGVGTTVPSASSPLQYVAAAINPVTNQAYLLCARSNTVGVLDGTNGYAMSTSISVGSGPVALAVNPVKNKVYVVNQGEGTVTVIDGASNTAGTLTTGLQPQSVAVNPLTNKIYVANLRSNNVTAIDGATGTAVTIPVGSAPNGIDVDPLANKVYAINSGSSNVTVIDGVTAATTTVAVGAHPIGIAVNPQTGKVYVASSGDNTVTVIDGTTLATTSISTGPLASAAPFFRIGVNPVTNKIYVPAGGGSVLVIDGATNATASVTTGGSPNEVVVNAASNRAYVLNSTNAVTVIDGDTNLTTAVPLGFNALDLAVNPLTNRIYALGADTTAVMAVVDGASNAMTRVPLPLSAVTTVLAVDTVTNKIYAGSLLGTVYNGVISVDGESNGPLLAGSTPQAFVASALALAVNPATSRVYAVSSLAGSPGGFLAEDGMQASAPQIAVSPLTGQRTSSSTPSFTLSIAGGNAATVEGVFYRFDTRAGEWASAGRNVDGTFTAAATTALLPGLHLLLAFSTNGQASTLSGTGAGVGDAESPLTTAIVSYPFFVTGRTATTPTLTTIAVTGPAIAEVTGASVSFTATGTFTDGSRRDITNQVAWTSSNPAVASVGPNGIALAAAPGSTTITASTGGISGNASMAVESPILQVAVVPAVSAAMGVGRVVTVTITNSGNVPVTNIQFTQALLNGVPASPAPSPGSNAINPGQSLSVAMTFPASAGAAGSRASLQVQGTYQASLPNGSTQTATFASSYRIVLP